MFNYTKMELNRIFRMKSMIIALFLMALWILANGIILQRFDVYGILGEDAEMYMAMAEEGEDSTMSEQMSDSFEAGFNAGFEIGAAEAEAEEDVEEEEYDFSQILSGGMYEEATVAEMYLLNVTSLGALFSQALIVSLFIGSTYSVGFGRNITKANKNRAKLMGGSLIAITIATIVLRIIHFLEVIGFTYLLGENTELGFTKSFWIYFLFIMLFSIMFSLFVAMVGVLFKNMAGALAVGLALSLGFSSFFLVIVNQIVVMVFKIENFDIMEYTPDGLFMTFNLDLEGEAVIRSLVVAIVYLVVSILVSLSLTKKRDI